MELPPIKAELIIKLAESDKTIETKMLAAMQKHVNYRFQLAQPIIISRLKYQVAEWIMDTDEVQSLLDGQLRADFGIPSPSTSVTNIVESITRTVTVVFKPVSKTLTGQVLTVAVQPRSLANVLGLGETIITKKGAKLDWLEWLLVRGDDIIVADYHVEYGPFGRTGEAHMILPGLFRVDPAFSGTSKDNFVTRALDDKVNDMIRIIANAMAK
jgi:hypothetical protein